MELVTENHEQCDRVSDHLQTCDTCMEASVSIHAAGAAIESWAAAIAEIANEISPDRRRRETLLGAIGGLAWAIQMRCDMDVTSESLEGEHKNDTQVTTPAY